MFRIGSYKFSFSFDLSLCSRLRNVLFPTLIAACFENEENKKIIEQEVSCALLENYVEVRNTTRLCSLFHCSQCVFKKFSIFVWPETWQGIGVHIVFLTILIGLRLSALPLLQSSLAKYYTRVLG